MEGLIKFPLCISCLHFLCDPDNQPSSAMKQAIETGQLIGVERYLLQTEIVT